MAKRLANTALTSPAIIPLVYWVSNLKMVIIPRIINDPASNSSFEMRFLLIRGSNIAVNNVIEERHTSVTATVDNLIDAKKRIQCPPTSAPVQASCKNVLLFTAKTVLLNLK